MEDKNIGKTYGRLKILRKDEERIAYEKERKKNGLVKHVTTDHYICECQCGNVITTRLNGLRLGTTKSCGCYNREQIAIRSKRENFYEIKEDIVIGWDYKREHYFIIDKEDYEIVKGYSWHYDTSYAYFITKKNRTSIRLHQLICKLKYGEYDKEKFVPDHVNRNGLDNRRVNIELKTYSENNRNRSIQKNNKSGKTGVSFHKRDKRWRAYIKVNRKDISLGYFDTYEQACNARLEAEKRYGFIGDSPINH